MHEHRDHFPPAAQELRDATPHDDGHVVGHDFADQTVFTFKQIALVYGRRRGRHVQDFRTSEREGVADLRPPRGFGPLPRNPARFLFVQIFRRIAQELAVDIFHVQTLRDLPPDVRSAAASLS